MHIRKILVTGVVFASLSMLSLQLTGCGDDKKDDDNSGGGKDACADCGKGSVTKATDTTITLDFSKAGAGAQYVVLPYLLGDPTTVLGGTDTPFSFAVAAPAAASGGSGLVDQASGHRQAAARLTAGDAFPAMTYAEYDHALRTLMNRYEPSKGPNQDPAFYALARRADAFAQGMGLQDFGEYAVAAGGMGKIESYYRSGTLPAHHRRAAFGLAAGTCPKVGDPISVPSAADATKPTDFTIPATATTFDGTDYCVVYVETPTTGGDAATVQKSLTEIMRRYKQVLYKGESFAAVNGYTFKPIYVVMDFTNATEWPVAQELAGAFSGGMSDDMGVPVLFMPSDVKKFKIYAGATNFDADLEKRKWHGTLAHETQHAIMNYYRHYVVKGGTLETASIDEGIAHYVEDLFGHGQENFADFAMLYFQQWAKVDADYNVPVLDATASASVNRGAGQAFIYYLMSQKGGVTFDASTGAFADSAATQFLASVVTKANGKIGPENLAAQYGGDWATTVGDFYGALVLDNLGIDGTDPVFQVQAPATMVDLLGTSATYGMRYNGYSGEPTQAYATALTNGMTTVDQVYYATRPMTYTVADPAKSVTLTTKDTIPNTAATVVRIK